MRGEASAKRNLVDHPVATARGTDLTDPDATESVPRAVATGSSMGSLSAYILMLKLTAMHPEEAVALTLKSASPNVLFAKALKVIVWLALAMLKVFTPALSA